MMLLLLALAALPGVPTAQPVPTAQRFVVLGHIRGDASRGLSPRLTELLDRVRRIRPEFVLLTGDIIWGDVQDEVTDPTSLERQWNEVDSALATLGVPVFRVPGNHDISDGVSRDLYARRYGLPPQTVRIGPSRILLLSSTWIPPVGDTGKRRYIRGHPLDPEQIEFLRRELASPPGAARHTFVAMHHLLWWDPDDGPWWREVHPLLAQAGVRAVFTGDYGPLKFSTVERDGVRYYQTSIETPVSLQILRNRLSSRLLSAQFDNFLEVQVEGPGVDVMVHPVAEVSSGEFTPARYRAVNEVQELPEPLARRIWNRIGTPKRLGALVGGLAIVFLSGWLLGRAAGRRTPGRDPSAPTGR